MGERDIVVALSVGGGLFAWRIVDALRTGVLKGPAGIKGADIRRSERPVRFRIDLGAQSLCAALCFLSAILLEVFVVRKGG